MDPRLGSEAESQLRERRYRALIHVFLQSKCQYLVTFIKITVVTHVDYMEFTFEI